MGPGGEHSTSVLGHGKNISRVHLIDLGKKAELKTEDAEEVIERVEAAISNWQVYASESCVSQDSNDMITKSLAEVSL